MFWLIFFFVFFFSSRRRHTICALVTGVQTCALPIWTYWPTRALSLEVLRRGGRVTRFDHGGGTGINLLEEVWNLTDLSVSTRFVVPTEAKIGRASCRERVCQYV